MHGTLTQQQGFQLSLGMEDLPSHITPPKPSSPTHGQADSRQTRFLLQATGETIEILPGSIKEVECIYREIFEDEVYSQHGIAVRAGDVVLDVGANIGMFCLYARLASSGPREGATAPPVEYYGFEALPPVFEVLQRNVGGARQGRTASTLLNVALGDEVRGAVPFTYYPLLPGNSTLNPREKRRMQSGIVEPEYFEGATEYLVAMRTLSDVIEELGLERVDYLKVDVEGAELMVLRGVKAGDWSRIRQVVAEVTDCEEAGEDAKRVSLVIGLLQERGFNVQVELHADARNYMVYAMRM